MGQAVLLFLQFFILALRWCKFVQLLYLKGQIVLFSLALGRHLDGFAQSFLFTYIYMVGLLVGCQNGRVFGHGVEHMQLEPFVAQQQVLVLRMDVDEVGSQFFELNECGG